ncbi:hypothetical protein [Pleurocapsa sp. FMAR1]|nr:hypothetical protein [Pleurocapsa sp. FMAR1]
MLSNKSDRTLAFLIYPNYYAQMKVSIADKQLQIVKANLKNEHPKQ